MPAISYLRRRDIERNEIVKWKVGHCATGLFKDRVIIPSFDLDGDVNYFIARSYSRTAFPKYKNPNVPKNIIFNELFLDFKKDLVIVEGVFDAINAGGNVVPILGSTLDEKHPLFQKIIRNEISVYLALDHDARTKETKIAKLLSSYGISVYKIDTSGYSDVGVMPRDVYSYRKARASLFTESTLINHRFA